MSDKPDKKKTPMSKKDADRIGKSDTPDEGFKERARDAAEKNEAKWLSYTSTEHIGSWIVAIRTKKYNTGSDYLHN